MSGTSGDKALSDDQILSSFGYRQELRRALRLFSLYAVSFSFISITTGIFLNFGFGITHLGAASIWLWPLASVGQLLVALVVAELGTRIPLAGYAYQWGARLVNPAYGWFVGFTGLLYMVVGGAAINFVVAAPLWATIFGWDAGNQKLMLLIALILFLATTAVNILGVAIAARINNVAVFTEIVGTTVLGIVLFILWATKPIHAFSFLTNTGGVHGSAIWGSAALAALMGIFTLVGFEMAADLSEEAINARFTVPKAVLWSTGSAAVLGMIALIGFTIAIPNLAKIQASATPLPDIIAYWMGPTITKIFLLFVVFSMFALIVVGAAAQGRLIYALARDNMIPFSDVLGRVHARTHTPVTALVVSMVLGLLFTLYGYAQGNAFGTLVAATATLPYIVYLLTVIAYIRRRQTLVALPGTFSLGAWRGPVIAGALVWLVAALLVLTIPADFRSADYVVVGVEVVALAWYALALRARLRAGTAGASLAVQAEIPGVRLS